MGPIQLPEPKLKTQIAIEGEIVETFEKDGQVFAKIHFNDCYVEISLNKMKDAHLGDRVLMTAELKIINLSRNLTEFTD